MNFTNPVNATTGVFINRKITATFSEAMAPSTIPAAFTLDNTTTPGPVAGVVTYDVSNHIATFAPNAALAASSSFRGTITTAVTDLAGNALAANKVWTFSTGTTSARPLPPCCPRPPQISRSGSPSTGA